MITKPKVLKKKSSAVTSKVGDEKPRLKKRKISASSGVTTEVEKPKKKLLKKSTSTVSSTSKTVGTTTLKKKKVVKKVSTVAKTPLSEKVKEASSAVNDFLNVAKSVTVEPSPPLKEEPQAPAPVVEKVKPTPPPLTKPEPQVPKEFYIKRGVKAVHIDGKATTIENPDFGNIVDKAKYNLSNIDFQPFEDREIISIGNFAGLLPRMFSNVSSGTDKNEKAVKDFLEALDSLTDYSLAIFDVNQIYRHAIANIFGDKIIFQENYRNATGSQMTIYLAELH